MGLAVLLLATAAQSLRAAPPQTGIRGQTFFYQPGFWVEISPGIWLGDGGFSFPWSASFAVLSAHSGREVTHVSSDANGEFEVSLPPGKYVVVPNTLFWSAPMTAPFELTVTAKNFTDTSIYWGGPIFYFTP
jgi:hypothetical protein